VGVLPFSTVVRAIRRRADRSRRWEAGKSCPRPLATACRVLASRQSNEASNLALERTAGSHPLAAAAQRGVMRSGEMTDCFTIESVHGGSKVEFTGTVARGLDGYDGCEYLVRLGGGGVEASETVYDIQPHRWADMFEDLAKHWKGWEGEKAYESLEYQLKISCAVDRTGHVHLRVSLRGDMAGSNWRAEDTLYLEAGQLDYLAARARAYFG